MRQHPSRFLKRTLACALLALSAFNCGAFELIVRDSVQSGAPLAPGFVLLVTMPGATETTIVLNSNNTYTFQLPGHIHGFQARISHPTYVGASRWVTTAVGSTYIFGVVRWDDAHLVPKTTVSGTPGNRTILTSSALLMSSYLEPGTTNSIVCEMPQQYQEQAGAASTSPSTMSLNSNSPTRYRAVVVRSERGVHAQFWNRPDCPGTDLPPILIPRGLSERITISCPRTLAETEATLSSQISTSLSQSVDAGLEDVIRACC
jgi:hypothetical protein